MQSVYGSPQPGSLERNVDKTPKTRHKRHTSPKSPLTTDVKTKGVLMPVKYDKATVQKASVHVAQTPVVYGEHCIISGSKFGCGALFSSELMFLDFAGAASCAATCARHSGICLQLPSQTGHVVTPE